MMDLCPKESSYLCQNSGFFYPKRGGGSCCLLQTSGCQNSLFLQLSMQVWSPCIDKTIVIFWSAAFYLSMNGSVLPLKVKPVGQSLESVPPCIFQATGKVLLQRCTAGMAIEHKGQSQQTRSSTKSDLFFSVTILLSGVNVS